MINPSGRAQAGRTLNNLSNPEIPCHVRPSGLQLTVIGGQSEFSTRSDSERHYVRDVTSY